MVHTHKILITKNKEKKSNLSKDVLNEPITRENSSVLLISTPKDEENWSIISSETKNALSH